MRSLFALKLNWEKKGKRMKAKILTSFKNKYKNKAELSLCFNGDLHCII